MGGRFFLIDGIEWIDEIDGIEGMMRMKGFKFHVSRFSCADLAALG